MTPAARSWRLALLGVAAAATAAVALALGPLPQPPSYHRFADQRQFLGLAHALNILSNLVFPLVGAWGIGSLFGRRGVRLAAPWERWPWAVYLTSVMLTGLGSAYYHRAPSDSTLLWDRLPMALGFAALLGIVVIEHVSPRWGARLFVPLVALGLATLLSHPHDLRFYALLQVWTAVLVAMMFALFPSRYTETRTFAAALLLFALAALLDRSDALVFRAGGLVSGHTLKHLVAGVAAWRVVVMLRRRHPV